MFKQTVLVSLVIFSAQCVQASQQAPSSPTPTRRLVCPDAPKRNRNSLESRYHAAQRQVQVLRYLMSGERKAAAAFQAIQNEGGQ